MKTISSIIGIILIILGIGILVYRGYTYTTEEKVAEIGNLKVTAERQKTIYFTPLSGTLAVVAGIVLVAVSRRK